VTSVAKTATPLTYLYCLVASARKPRVDGLPPGVPGTGPARAIGAGGGLWLIAADGAEAELDESALATGISNIDWVSRRAMGHERVIEHFLPAAAVIPMQLFTIFTSDERALAHVSKSRARINKAVARIKGHHEWGLRVTWDEQAARSSVEASHSLRSKTARPGGAAYLARKRDLLELGRSQMTAARASAAKLFRQMSKEATAAARHTDTEQAAPGSRLLLSAAFLVPVKKSTAFRNALKKQAQPLSGHGLVISLSGPWPAYNFI
jgi:hypothetical protein